MRENSNYKNLNAIANLKKSPAGTIYENQDFGSISNNKIGL